MQRFWTTAELLARGKTEREIRRALEQRAIQAVRKGHHAAADTPGALIRAVRVGGVLTGPSAAKLLGLWTPPDPVPGSPHPRTPDDEVAALLHVAVPRWEHRLRDPDDWTRPLGAREDVVIHRVDADLLDTARRTGTAPTLMVLQHVFEHLPPERALAVLDSALHERHLRRADLAVLAASLPPRLRSVVGSADGRAESGLESIVRYLLQLAGLHVEIIVGVRGVGSVDLVVEGWLIIECDGKRWHTKEEAFDNDRRRDLVSTIERYRTLRLTWYKVLFCWPQVESAVFSALGSR